MSERWKYQIKSGGIWGIFMTVFNVLFELKEKPIGVQVTSQNFYIRAVAFILIGIFVLAYFNWKDKIKKREFVKK